MSRTRSTPRKDKAYRGLNPRAKASARRNRRERIARSNPDLTPKQVAALDAAAYERLHGTPDV